MCLAVPGKVVRREADERDEAVVDLEGNAVRICTALVPALEVGDWVLVHAGFAIQRLGPGAAEEARALVEQVRAADGRLS